MKIAVNNFKAVIDKISPRLLPTENAQIASSTKHDSGDLEPLLADIAATNQTTKTGTLKTIYGFDRGSGGNLKWLHWTSTDSVHPDGEAGRVEVAEGFNVGDTKKRYYFTGTDVPRETTTDLATNGGTNYPMVHYKLGTPNPITKPTAVESEPTNYLTVSDGSDLTGWELSPQETTTYTSTVAIANISGINYFQFKAVGIPDGVVGPFANIDIGSNVGQFVGLKFNFLLRNDNDIFGAFVGTNPSATSGKGVVVRIDRTATNTLRIRVGQPFGYGYLALTATTDVTTSAFTLTSDVTATFYLNRSQYPNKWTLSLEQGTTVVNYSGTLANNITYPTGYIGFSGVQTSGSKEFNIRNIEFASSASEDADATEYVVTWISTKDGLDEESGPSPPSGLVFMSPGGSITISNIADPTSTQITEYNITKKYLYRAVTGSAGTVRQFVDEISLGTTTYTDNTETSDLEPTFLESDNWELPPTNGRYITALPNGIMLIASGRDICPSVQYKPHTYPLDYRLAVDGDVVGIAHLTSTSYRPNEATAIVLTTTGAYILTGSASDSLVLSKIAGAYGCASPKSVCVSRQYGVTYSSPDGLITITSQGAVNLTEKFITRKQWQTDYKYNEIIGTWHNELFIGFFGSGDGFIFDPRSDTGISKFTYDARHIFLDQERDELFFIDSTGSVREWEGSTAPLTYTWKSKLFKLPYPTFFEYAQVDGYPVTLKLYNNGTLYFTKSVTDEKEFVLPPEVCSNFEFQLEGSSTVRSVQFSDEVMELE